MVDARTISAAAKIPGRIGEILVREGDRVEKGAVLARIEIPELEAKLGQVKAQQDAAKGCVLFGNLNPAQILVAKSADEVYQISKTLCEQMKPFGGFILAPGCDLAPTIPLENLQAMARAASEV